MLGKAQYACQKPMGSTCVHTNAVRHYGRALMFYIIMYAGGFGPLPNWYSRMCGGVPSRG